jgi:hypothetical protein
MARVLAAFMLCCTALAGMSSAEAAAARPAAVEIKGPKGALGQLPLQVMDDGVSYIAAERLASLLKGSWVVKGKTGTLTIAKRSAQFSRDLSRLQLQGQPIVLEGAPRVTAKGWLIPADFLDKGLGRLVPGVRAPPRRRGSCPSSAWTPAWPSRSCASARIRPSPGSWSRRPPVCPT